MLFFNACAQLETNQSLELVKKVSSNMPKSFLSYPRLSTSLLDALIKCGDCLRAEEMFQNMNKSVKEYGNLMNGFNKMNQPEKTLNLFHQMQIDSIEADLITYLCLIKALAQIGILSMSEKLIEHIPLNFLKNPLIQNALIDMWVSSIESDFSIIFHLSFV